MLSHQLPTSGSSWSWTWSDQSITQLRAADRHHLPSSSMSEITFRCRCSGVAPFWMVSPPHGDIASQNVTHCWPSNSNLWTISYTLRTCLFQSPIPLFIFRLFVAIHRFPSPTPRISILLLVLAYSTFHRLCLILYAFFRWKFLFYNDTTFNSLI